MPIIPDNEVTRLEKRQRGLQRVISSINDLTIYGIYHTNFPKLVSALEHSKDHVKVELLATKKRIIELGGDTVEEVYPTDKVTINNPVVVDHSIEIPDHDE